MNDGTDKDFMVYCASIPLDFHKQYEMAFMGATLRNAWHNSAVHMQEFENSAQRWELECNKSYQHSLEPTIQ